MAVYWEVTNQTAHIFTNPEREKILQKVPSVRCLVASNEGSAQNTVTVNSQRKAVKS